MAAIWCQMLREWVGQKCGGCGCDENAPAGAPAPAQVVPLRSDRKSAAPLGPDSEVVDTICQMLIDAQAGKLIGFTGVLFDPIGQLNILSVGKITHGQVISGLELGKFEALMKWSHHNAGNK